MYLLSPVAVLLERIGDMKPDSRHQEVCLLAINDARRNQKRRTYDDIDKAEGLVNICARKIRTEGRSMCCRKWRLHSLRLSASSGSETVGLEPLLADAHPECSPSAVFLLENRGQCASYDRTELTPAPGCTS